MVNAMYVKLLQSPVSRVLCLKLDVCINLWNNSPLTFLSLIDALCSVHTTLKGDH